MKNVTDTKKKKVGIPRALFYFEYYPFWKTFFEELGFDVISSECTNKKILESGIESCVGEACLPMKSMFGHVIHLKDKVDYLFLPRLSSVSEEEYLCPMVSGMPDMIRNNIAPLPTLIMPQINVKKYKHKNPFLYEIGEILEINTFTIQSSYQKSTQYHQTTKPDDSKLLLQNGMTNYTAIGQRMKDAEIHLVLMGHMYTLYDNHLNMNVIKKLQSYPSLRITTVDMLGCSNQKTPSPLLKKKMFWKYGRQVTHVVQHLIQNNIADGVMYLSAFGCGIDSFVADIAGRVLRRNDIPFLLLHFDEHSGEAGLITRIDAFIDILSWRHTHETHLPPHG